MFWYKLRNSNINPQTEYNQVYHKKAILYTLFQAY